MLYTKRTDTYDIITYQCETEDGSRVDLTGASVNFVMGKKNKMITNAPAQITSAVDGIVSYQLTASDTLVSGQFLGEFEVTFPNGDIKHFPSNGYINVNIADNIDTNNVNVVLDMIAVKQGDFEAKLSSILAQAGNVNMSSIDEYTWNSIANQVTYVFPVTSSYTKNAKWFKVYVGNIPVDDSLINRSAFTSFELMIDPTLIKEGTKVTAQWMQPMAAIAPTSYKVIPQQDIPPVEAVEGDLWFDTSDDTYQGTILEDIDTRMTNAETSLAENASQIGNRQSSYSGFIYDTLTSMFNDMETRLFEQGINPKNEKYGAVGDGNSHPIYSSNPNVLSYQAFSTKAGMQAKYPLLTDSYLTGIGVDPTTNAWQTLELDWCAIQQAINDGVVKLPTGTFVINKALDKNSMYLIGVGDSRSKIQQNVTTEPILATGGVCWISGVYLYHQNTPSAYADDNNPDKTGTGIYLKYGTSDRAYIANLHIYNVTSGIFNSDTEGKHIYSTTIHTIRIARYRHSSIYIGGSGHTGNAFFNIYTTNWDDYNKATKMTSAFGMVFKGLNEGFASQLNIEHTRTNKALVISLGNGGMKFDSIHFEGVVPNGTFASLIYADGTNTKAFITGVSVVYSNVEVGKIWDNVSSSVTFSALTLGNNARVKITGFSESNNNYVTPWYSGKLFNQNDAVVWNGNYYYATNTGYAGGTPAGATGTPPTHTSGAVSDGGVTWQYSSNGTWVASKVYNVGDSVFVNGKHYGCTVAGTSSATPPSHSSGTATDGSVTWQFITLNVRKFFGAGSMTAGAYVIAEMFHMSNNFFNTVDYFPISGTFVKQMNNNYFYIDTTLTASSVPNGCMFIDSADSKLKFKDNSGVVNLLY